MKNQDTILITGANRGIGLELVKESLVTGLNVIGTYRNIKNSKELTQIKSEKLKIFEMNVIDEKSILEVSKNIKKPIDYLICNAGINNGFGTIFEDDHSHEKMLEVLNINVLGCVLTIKNFIKNLNNNAKIILISSVMGMQAHSGSSATIYRASKAAVNNIMVSISEDLKSDKNSNIVSSRWVRTNMGGSNATLSAKEKKSLIKVF